jgi:hypothetical protein
MGLVDVYITRVDAAACRSTTEPWLQLAAVREMLWKWYCRCCSRRDVLVHVCDVACRDAASACCIATGTAALAAGKMGVGKVMMHVCKEHTWC